MTNRQDKARVGTSRSQPGAKVSRRNEKQSIPAPAVEVTPGNVRIIRPTDFISITPEGRLDVAASRRLLREVVAAAAELTRYAVVMDTRKADTDLSPTDLWYLAKEVAEFRQVFVRKTAVLCPRKRFDRAEFFALCATNRGLSVRAFVSYEAAIKWASSA